ncbi:MAG: hypothetical protein AAF842_10635 [Planctomycetota bacterium]
MLISLFVVAPSYAVIHPTLGRFLQRDPLGYVDGTSIYANYASMTGRLDPQGTSTESGCCCESITIEILDKQWTLYSRQGGRKFGARIRTTFKVRGDVTKCSYYQDESGPGGLARAFIRSRRENLKGTDVGEWLSKRGVNNQIDEGNADFDQDSQTVTYTDHMGSFYSIDHRRPVLKVQVLLAARMRCYASSPGDQAILERDFTWGAHQADGVVGTAHRDRHGKFTTTGENPEASIGQQRRRPSR